MNKIISLRHLSMVTQLSFALVLQSSLLHSQDSAVVFVHGVNSNGPVWNYISGNLQQRLRIAPVLPTLDWLRTEEEQAAELGEILNSNTLTMDPARRMPFVAHSNGGLVSREYRRAGGRVRQLATVGTPHSGAPLANNWLNYNTILASQNLLNRMFIPLQYYSADDQESPIVIDIAYYLLYPLASLVNALDALLCPIAGLCAGVINGTYVFAPVVYDLAVGSPTTEILNGSANIAAEAADLERRVGLRTATPPDGALFDIFTEDPEAWIVAQELAISAYILGYQHYRDHWDYFLAANAWLWVDGAVALIDIDAVWQTLIGTFVDYQRYVLPDIFVYGTLLWANPSDGLVPHASSVYPGGTHNIELVQAISHSKQLRSLAVANELFGALNSVFGIPIRDGPLPPTYSVNLIGPSAAKPGNTCFWSSSSNIPDAVFEWQVDGVSIGSGPELYLQVQSSFTLAVHAYNSQNASAFSSVYINVSSENSNCGIL